MLTTVVIISALGTATGLLFFKTSQRRKTLPAIQEYVCQITSCIWRFSFAMSLCPHVPTGERLNGFSWNFTQPANENLTVYTSCVWNQTRITVTLHDHLQALCERMTTVVTLSTPESETGSKQNVKHALYARNTCSLSWVSKQVNNRNCLYCRNTIKRGRTRLVTVCAYGLCLFCT